MSSTWSWFPDCCRSRSTPSAHRDGHGKAAGNLEKFIESRRRRQQILERSAPPTLSFLLDEAVPSREIGGPETMRAQLEHLRDPGGPALFFTAAEWTAFLAGAAGSEFDLPVA